MKRRNECCSGLGRLILADDRYRRVAAVAACSGECLLTRAIPDARSRQWQLLILPHTRHSGSPRRTARSGGKRTPATELWTSWSCPTWCATRSPYLAPGQRNAADVKANICGSLEVSSGRGYTPPVKSPRPGAGELRRAIGRCSTRSSGSCDWLWRRERHSLDPGPPRHA